MTSVSLRRLVRGASIYTFGQLLTKASTFFLIPLYTRFLTPEDFGIVGYLQVFVQIGSTVLMLGFYGAQTRFYHEHKENRTILGEFLFSTNLFLVLVLLVFCVGLSVVGPNLFGGRSPQAIPFSPYLLIVIWSVFFIVLNQMVIQYSVAAQEYKRAALLQIIQFFFTAAFTVVFIVILRWGALGQITGIFLGQVSAFLLFFPSYLRLFRWRFSVQYVKYSLAFGVPIVFHLLATTVHNSVDRIMLEHYVSLDELGLYTLGYQIGMVMSVVTASFNQVWQPSFYSLMSSDSTSKEYENRRILSLWLLAAGTICIVGMLWSNQLLAFFIPTSFIGVTRIVPIILFSYLVNGLYFFSVTPLFFYKKTQYLPLLTGFSALVNILLNSYLIPRYGIVGSAYATLISFCFQTLIVYIVSSRYFNPKYDLKKIIMLCLWVSVALVPSLPMYGSNNLIAIKFALLSSYLVLWILLFGEYLKLHLKWVWFLK